ncbi:MAG: hydroxysqualene dehydroxylase HpnE [Alphaproteobacteria bacterium]|nr:hydroxysqualene dehydroxylase HpnE [Alphaproteobacteria bacterium]
MTSKTKKKKVKTPPPPVHVHIIGAGLSGLSAALQLTLMGQKVTVYESAPYAGGRARSYFDKELGCHIDNGNHLIFSGNIATMNYLELTGATATLRQQKEALFPFMDRTSNARWSLHMNKGRLPWWIFSKKRRLPDTPSWDYLSALRFVLAHEDKTVAQCVDRESLIFKRLFEPLAIATLNTEIETASARMLGNLMTQSFLGGGRACLPVIPKIGMSESFVTPCLNTLRQHGTQIKFRHRLRGYDVTRTGRITNLDFGEHTVELAPQDWVILAVPAWVAKDLVPKLQTPDDFRAITNVHYRVQMPQNAVGFTGVVNGLAEWIFVRPGVVSVTISASDRYEESPQEAWAAAVWDDLAHLFDLDPDKIPPWRVLKEKRATFAASPAQNRKRPTAYIGWENVALAGDWTATGLPATIESAIRSGIKASQVVLRWQKH